MPGQRTRLIFDPNPRSYRRSFPERVANPAWYYPAMEFPAILPKILAIGVFGVIAASAQIQAQNAPPPPPRTLLDRLNAMLSGGKSAWTPEQIAVMERLRDAAMKDPYAYNELRHLTDNIGPRLSGSPQAAHAVEYVAAEMRALGAEVTLEKAKGPHWIRGSESAERLAWPGPG